MSLSVGERFPAHRTGIDSSYGSNEVLEPTFTRALVRAEDAIVFACKGVAEVVLEQRAGAYDDGGLTVVVQHLLELLEYIVRKLSCENSLARLLGAFEESLGVSLFLSVPPDAVSDKECVEDIGSDVKRVLRLQDIPHSLFLLFEDAAC